MDLYLKMFVFKLSVLETCQTRPDQTKSDQILEKLKSVMIRSLHITFFCFSLFLHSINYIVLQPGSWFQILTSERFTMNCDLFFVVSLLQGVVFSLLRSFTKRV